jgi:hypothetical protein
MRVGRGLALLVAGALLMSACGDDDTTDADAADAAGASSASSDAALETFCARTEQLAALQSSEGPPDQAALDALANLDEGDAPTDIADDVAQLDESISAALDSAPGMNGSGAPDDAQLQAYSDALEAIDTASAHIREYVADNCS